MDFFDAPRAVRTAISFLTCGTAGEQEVCDVHTSDKQKKCTGCEEEPKDGTGPTVNIGMFESVNIPLMTKTLVRLVSPRP